LSCYITGSVAATLNVSLRRELTELAQTFAIFECVECADCLRDFLRSRGISCQQIELFSGSVQDPFCNIYHDGLGCNISINGRHVGIQVLIDDINLIFDNLHPEGIPRVEWINSFYCPIQDLGGSFQITATTF